MRTWGMSLLSLLLFAGCDRARETREPSQERHVPKDDTVHVLTWKDYNGLTDSPDQARYVFDGRVVGTGKAGIEALKALQLPVGSKVRIDYPWVYGPSSPPYMPPDDIEGLIAYWQSRGVTVDDVSGFKMSPHAK